MGSSAAVAPRGADTADTGLQRAAAGGNLFGAGFLRGPSEQYDRVCRTSGNKYHGLTPFFYKEKNNVYQTLHPKTIKSNQTPGMNVH